MVYSPSVERLQVFAEYKKNKKPGEQITISELGRVVSNNAEAGRLLYYLSLADVIERRLGGGYFFPDFNNPEDILTNLIEHGPIIYPKNPDEPVKVYGRLEEYPSHMILHIHGCEIEVRPSIDTIQENKRQIIQGRTIINAPIEMDHINRWILRRFFDKMKIYEFGSFALHERGMIIPSHSLYVFSASNIAESAAKPAATLEYLSCNDIMTEFRKSAKKLISYEQGLEMGNTHAIREAIENFWGDYDRTVSVFVQETQGRIREELIDKVMSLWHPKGLEIEILEVKETGLMPTLERKSRLMTLAKRLFPF